MKTRTIIMMLTLLVAGLAIGCSSAPEAPAAPIYTEEEIITIAIGGTRSGCFGRTLPESIYWGVSTSNFFQTESATFKPNGLWLVTAKKSWDEQKTKGYNSETGKIIDVGDKYPREQRVVECTVLVDDATGRVMPR